MCATTACTAFHHVLLLIVSPDFDALSIPFTVFFHSPPTEYDWQVRFVDLVNGDESEDWADLYDRKVAVMPDLEELAFDQRSVGGQFIPGEYPAEFYPTESEIAELDGEDNEKVGGGKERSKNGVTTAAAKDAGNDFVSGQVRISRDMSDYFDRVAALGPEVEAAIMLSLWFIIFSEAQRAALVLAGTARAAAFGFR